MGREEWVNFEEIHLFFCVEIYTDFTTFSKADGLHCLIIFILRERGREGEREGETHRCEMETLIIVSRVPRSGGPGPQPRRVP